MKIKWYGHSCFLLTAGNGARFLTDPCDGSTGYTLRNIETDAVTVSHDHFDHNYLPAVLGTPEVFKAEGEYSFLGVDLKAVHTWHDEKQGALRGPNLVFVFSMDGLTVAHLGDLGHVPDAETVKAIGPVDVLLIPIGGVYTIDAQGARAVADLLQPKVIIPMHYKTKDLKMGLAGVEPFLSAMQDRSIHRLSECEITLTPDSLGNGRVLLPDYAK